MLIPTPAQDTDWLQRPRVTAALSVGSASNRAHSKTSRLLQALGTQGTPKLWEFDVRAYDLRPLRLLLDHLGLESFVDASLDDLGNEGVRYGLR